jgi:hypothetical protein
MNKLQKDLAKYRKFVITTAVMGCKIHKQFIQSIKNYCKVNDAALLILPIWSGSVQYKKEKLDNYLINEFIVLGDMKINNNLFISSITTSARQINPLTGVARIGQRNGSCIYASPKQFMEPIATSNNKIPHVLMTTGACTVSKYDADTPRQSRVSYIADNDHTLGAIIVEVKNSKTFHFRQIQAEKSGNFCDLGKYYQKDKISEMPPDCFVIGDLHCGSIDPKALNNWFEISKVTKCDKWICHDIFDGYSINHHEIEKRSLQAQKAEKGELSLSDELRKTANILKTIAKKGIDEIVIVKSNHDEFLDRWLEDGKYTKDAHNLYTAIQLAKAQIEGSDPLKYGIETIGKLDDTVKSKIIWLNRDQDYSIANIQLGNHGDLGANGAKASLRTLENAYGNCVVGHQHTPKILRGVWVVGTSSYLKLRYNRGPSGWIQSSCLVYPNGSRQMINSINGEWTIDNKKIVEE